VANSLDATVTAYSMSSGVLTSLGASTNGTATTGAQPVPSVSIPSTNHFLYTVNYLGSSVSSFELSPTRYASELQEFSLHGQCLSNRRAAITHGSTKK